MRLKLVSLSPNFENQAGWGDDFPRVKLPAGGVRVGSGSGATAVLGQRIKVKTGKKYLIKAKARRQVGGSTKAKCQINWHDAKNCFISVSQRSFPVASHEQRHTFEVETPVGAKSAVLYVCSGSDDEVVYTEMGLYEIHQGLAEKVAAIALSAGKKFAIGLTFARSVFRDTMASLVPLARCLWYGMQPVQLEIPRLLLVTTALRARENKIASVLRENNFEVYLIFTDETPHKPDKNSYTQSFEAPNTFVARLMAVLLRPQVCHVFSGAVDSLIVELVGKAPFPVVCDLNDLFAPSLMNHNQERFAAVAFCLANADGLCARDLQPRVAKTENHWVLPKRTILFPEFPRGGQIPHPRRTGSADEIRVVSVGTFTLESLGHYDSAYLQLAELFIKHRIHFTIYPHWSYLRANGAVDEKRLHKDFRDFMALSKDSPYLHLMDPVPERELLALLSEHDFGLVSGGNPLFGQKLGLVTEKYMRSCYSGRISDYLDAGLPVLINREVAFGYRMLRHYGVALDLEQILQPDFADKLWDAKKDPELSRRVAMARQELALRNQAPRLIKFYRQIAEETPLPRKILAPKRGQKCSTNATTKFFRRLLDHLVRSLEARLAQKLPSYQKLSCEFASAKATILDLQNDLHAERKINGILPSLPSLSSRWKKLAGGVDMQTVSGLLNWKAIADKNYRYQSFVSLLDMVRLHKERGGTYSECWSLLGEKHLTDLLSEGFYKFKRLLPSHYFNFLVQENDPQKKFLLRSLPSGEARFCREAARTQKTHPNIPAHNQHQYRTFVLMLWRYAELLDRDGELKKLSEPLLGDPFKIEWKNRPVSSDLANAFLEYLSIKEALDGRKPDTIVEIGGGYGRTAYLLLQLLKPTRMIMVDIPPALYVAQRYLTTLFPNLRALTCEEFESAKNKGELLDNAELLFLLPHQTIDLPDNCADLLVNISSLGEMTREQIDNTINEIDRVGKGVFYTKQWKVSRNPFDDLIISAQNYGFPQHWKTIFERECKVQTEFFEAAFEIP